MTHAYRRATQDVPAGLLAAAAGATATDRTLLPVYACEIPAGSRRTADALPTRVAGFQIANRDGENIQGDSDDPSGYPSFAILDAATAEAVIARWGPSHDIALQVIFHGDVEEPEYIRAAA